MQIVMCCGCLIDVIHTFVTCIMQEKIARVEDLINKLALQSCQNVLLGSPLARGVSGGEAKRSNIGIALVTSPKVLFLDEPTSGLDSYTANEVSLAAKYMLLGVEQLDDLHKLLLVLSCQS